MKKYLHYTIRFEDGEVFDSSDAWGGPLSFDEVGEAFPDQILDSIATLQPGEETSLTLQAEEAYGMRDEELVFSVERAKLPEDMALDAGSIFYNTLDEDEDLLCVVIDSDEETVTLDANHPLAGHVVSFQLRLEERSDSN